MTPRGPTDNFLNNRAFIAFDTETTGMWAAANRVVEIGAVKFWPGRDESETFQSLINPERPIPEEVIQIHGITDDMVADRETAQPVLERFIEFCGGDTILIAHNAPFDISFISCELDRTGLTFGDNPIIDTVDMARRFFPQLPSYSLLSLSKHFEIVEFQNHRALSDALMVWKLFLRIIEKFPPVSNLKAFKKLLTVYTMSQWKVEQRELPEEYRPLKQAIENNLAVEIVYAGVGKKAQPRVIRPTEVHCLGAIFYINAFCEKAKAERTFRLDRIESFKLLSD